MAIQAHTVGSYWLLSDAEWERLPADVRIQMLRNRVWYGRGASSNPLSLAASTARFWLIQNATGFVHVERPEYGPILVAFENETDMVHFKLRFAE